MILPGIGGVQLGGVRDPLFSNVALLIPGDGVEGQATGLDKSRAAYTLGIAGNAAIRVAQKKFGQSSIGFDGTGDYITGDTTFGALGNFDLTIEMWARANACKIAALCDFRALGVDSEPLIGWNDLGVPQLHVDGATRMSGAALAANTWHHFAAVRASKVWRFFVNGTQQGGTYTDVSNFTKRAFTLGTFSDQRSTTATNKFNGFVDDFRFTLGTARYFANFSPPMAACPLK